ncbi:MAG: hypothetical protein LUI05_04155 [Oscillospiraceae bacterium]|nr:hypothetical protein [Oscillospiraceae bacterium]
MLTAENKSVVFISHRLSAARIADRIYMLEKVRIIEDGSHSDLLNRKGKVCGDVGSPGGTILMTMECAVTTKRSGTKCFL